MQRFDTLHAVAAPYPQSDVDTDRIIRVERCARVPREEMGRWAFEVERYRPDGSESPDFVLNRPAFRSAGILVARDNFGCGSSREMAVWAIAGLGIRCVVASSFGPIFRGNCIQNGLLPLALDAGTVDGLLARLAEAAEGEPAGRMLRVDLRARQLATPWGEVHGFDIDPVERRSLLEGLDAIALTLQRRGEIDAFQARQQQARPWVYRS